MPRFAPNLRLIWVTFTQVIDRRRKVKSGTPWGAFDSARNHKRQRRKRQSVTAKREKSQTPKFVNVRLGQVRLC